MIFLNGTEMLLRIALLSLLCLVAACCVAEAQEEEEEEAREDSIRIKIGVGWSTEWTPRYTFELRERLFWPMPGSLRGYSLHADFNLSHPSIDTNSVGLNIRFRGTYMTGRASSIAPFWDSEPGGETELMAEYSITRINFDILGEFFLPPRLVLRLGPTIGSLASASGDIVRKTRIVEPHNGWAGGREETETLASGHWWSGDLTAGLVAQLGAQLSITDHISLIPELGLRYEINLSQSKSVLWPEFSAYAGVTAAYAMNLITPPDTTATEPPATDPP